MHRSVQLSVPAWSEKWIDYRLLKKLLYGIAASAGSLKPATETAAADPATSAGEVAFFKQLRFELRKVSIHFAQCEDQLLEQYRKMMDAFEAFCNRQAAKTSTSPGNDGPKGAGAGGPGAAAAGSSPDEAKVPDVKWLLGQMVKLMSSLIQLENYAVMNYCGFGKALKKHDKLTGRTTKQAFMQACVNCQSFASYPVLLKLLSCTQDAWKLLVAMHPDQASVNVDLEEARKLEDLHEVKGVSSLQRAKELADHHSLAAASAAQRAKQQSLEQPHDGGGGAAVVTQGAQQAAAPASSVAQAYAMADQAQMMAQYQALQRQQLGLSVGLGMGPGMAAASLGMGMGMADPQLIAGMGVTGARGMGLGFAGSQPGVGLGMPGMISGMPAAAGMGMAAHNQLLAHQQMAARQQQLQAAAAHRLKRPLDDKSAAVASAASRPRLQAGLPAVYDPFAR